MREGNLHRSTRKNLGRGGGCFVVVGYATLRYDTMIYDRSELGKTREKKKRKTSYGFP